MENFCIITPDRNDRPELLNHCIWQMQRQTRQPGKHYLVNWPVAESKTQQPDITPRVKDGIDKAINDGFEYAFIIENDDYYPVDYLESMLNSIINNNTDFVGIDQSIFYLINTGEYKKIIHPGRSALACTGFRLKAMKAFPWPEQSCLYLDMKLWDYAITKKYTLLTAPGNLLLKDWRYPISLKHGTGYAPGTGHNNRLPNTQKDLNYIFLQSLVNFETFQFYKGHFQLTINN